MSVCMGCGGLVMEQGKCYGYAGKVCNCQPPRYVTHPMFMPKAPALSQPSVSVEEFTQSKLNAGLLGLDCRAAFEKHYAGYYLKRLENGEYASEETRKLWNCWWVSWDIARPERQPKQAHVTEGEIAEYLTKNSRCLYPHDTASAILQQFEIRRK